MIARPRRASPAKDSAVWRSLGDLDRAPRRGRQPSELATRVGVDVIPVVGQGCGGAADRATRRLPHRLRDRRARLLGAHWHAHGRGVAFDHMEGITPCTTGRAVALEDSDGILANTAIYHPVRQQPDRDDGLRHRRRVPDLRALRQQRPTRRSTTAPATQSYCRRRARRGRHRGGRGRPRRSSNCPRGQSPRRPRASTKRWLSAAVRSRR